ncbi:hypothetical protein HN51_041822 [Arachis hypogaea]|uniref:Uncharacterized protein n=1 Tax=Arachis hypogaea TaxID=3818 RepID=A0A444YUC3_ARAHY|nr:uncharacterized protein LOC107605199 [Arachis ipaensis]XP_025659277.1 uncharacterized protein LOC112755413 [Arachis hypogaea]QHN87650.1 uncharacterized protein DS421_16g556950 [Arachis hypogaea]RYR05498.1 hypothetical protein Ahy_B06g085358 [Arachis hypogaea]
MGKWDHRRPRRFFRRQRSPLHPSVFYDINAPLPDFSQDGVPLWEKKYCTLIGSVPWQKIVDSKYSINCHGNVLNWNDSAAEEAFHNAKNLYQARMNNLPSDISLPDPNMYVDQIDWNPYIDPKLIKEVDSTYFPVPGDEKESSNKIKRTKISVDDEDAWDCAGDTSPSRAFENRVQDSQEDYDVDDPGNVDNTENPWERSIPQQNGGLNNNAWEGGCVNSSSWNERRDPNIHSEVWKSGYTAWGNDCKGFLSQKDKGWGNVRDNSWCQQKSDNLVVGSNTWNCKSSQQNATSGSTGWGNVRDSSWCQQKSNNSFNSGKPWNCKSSKQNATPGSTRWCDDRDSSWCQQHSNNLVNKGNPGRNNNANMQGWEQWENSHVSSNSQFRRNNGGTTPWNQRFQRKEGYDQQTFDHNGSQFQRDDRQTGQYWRRENSKKRNFAYH